MKKKIFRSNGSHYCTDCGTVKKGKKMITIGENDYCEDCYDTKRKS